MLDKSTIESFKSRWTPTISAEALNVLEGKAQMTIFPEVEQRLDLRGLVIDRFIKGRQLRDLDLSACELVRFGQFGFCSFENCLFNQGSLTTNLGQSFRNCQFATANLRRATLNGEFLDCNFERTSMKGTGARNARFQRCIFRDCNFELAMFLQCTFEDCLIERCRFRGGSLHMSKLIRSNPTDCDFDGAILDGVSHS